MLFSQYMIDAALIKDLFDDDLLTCLLENGNSFVELNSFLSFAI